MKKLTLAMALLTSLTAGSALAVDISHSQMYGSTVTTGEVSSFSRGHTDTQSVTITGDQDAGRDFGDIKVFTVDNGHSTVVTAHEDKDGNIVGTSRTFQDVAVDNDVTSGSFNSSFTHETSRSDDSGSFQSVTNFAEASISVNGLTAAEGSRMTEYAQDMTGSSRTRGYTDTVSFDVATSDNNGAEAGTKYEFSTSHTNFGSNVDNKITHTSKNTITDYSFIK